MTLQFYSPTWNPQQRSILYFLGEKVKCTIIGKISVGKALIRNHVMCKFGVCVLDQIYSLLNMLASIQLVIKGQYSSHSHSTKLGYATFCWFCDAGSQNAVVRDVPAADHKRVQGNGFCPQHGGAMTSMHKVYLLYYAAAFRTVFKSKSFLPSNL